MLLNVEDSRQIHVGMTILILSEHGLLFSIGDKIYTKYDMTGPKLV